MLGLVKERCWATWYVGASSWYVGARGLAGRDKDNNLQNKKISPIAEVTDRSWRPPEELTRRSGCPGSSPGAHGTLWGRAKGKQAEAGVGQPIPSQLVGGCTQEAGQGRGQRRRRARSVAEAATAAAGRVAVRGRGGAAAGPLESAAVVCGEPRGRGGRRREGTTAGGVVGSRRQLQRRYRWLWRDALSRGGSRGMNRQLPLANPKGDRFESHI
eukprot:scaffold32931_cov62-Phaeocystis_antarctica.AAC.11